MRLSTRTGRKNPWRLVAGVIERQSAGWDEAVQVGMKLEVLAPGMENSEDTNARTEMARIGGDLQQGLGDRAKQHRIEEPLVAQSQMPQLFRNSEDYMGIGHRQQAGSLLEQPSIAC